MIRTFFIIFTIVISLWLGLAHLKAYWHTRKTIYLKISGVGFCTVIVSILLFEHLVSRIIWIVVMSSSVAGVFDHLMGTMKGVEDYYHPRQILAFCRPRSEIKEDKSYHGDLFVPTASHHPKDNANKVTWLLIIMCMIVVLFVFSAE